MLIFLVCKVSLATYYPACSAGNNKTSNKGWGVWDAQSVPGKALKRRLTYVLEDFGILMQR